MCKIFVDKKNYLCYIRATKGKQNGQANKPERKIKMKKYSYTHVVAFKDKKSGTIIITREYKTDDEYFEIMDSVDVNAWEMIFDKITR